MARPFATPHRASQGDRRAGSGGYPLVIISHGYPGNRFLMSHIGENLASKGFVVVSIDHKDSTYDDQKAFGSTLYNRPFDQLFVLNEIERLNRLGSGSFLTAHRRRHRTGIIGYSMGGYGVVNVIGGGYSAASATFQNAPPNKLLAERGAANAAYQKIARPAHQGGDRDRSVGHAGRILGCRRPAGHSHAGDVRGRKRRRCVGIRERHARDLPGRGERRSLPADVHQRQSQRRGAVSRAGRKLCGGAATRPVLPLRRRGVGHGAHEQHPPPLRDRVFRRVSER